MKVLKIIRDSINRVIENISIIMLTLMVLVITYQVFMRQVFETSPTWAQALSLFLFLWVGFLGVSYGFREKTHISVEVFYNVFPSSLKKAAALFNTLLIIGVGVVFTYYGFQFALSSMSVNLPGLNIPTGYEYMIIPIAGILMIFYGLVSLFKMEDAAGDQVINGEKEGN
ncbi:TRAP transporter small permease [Salibacterium aidingense]|uniref:TRAP transporter small permease n=1 Tax=Salibacterium aidingense TaxID=384933 RepID=UPI00042863CE|nr:TRAP transporter small permease [Salibacterium aidingense]